MSGFTEYGAAAVAAGTAIPQTLYVKLHTGDPGVNGIANPCVETTRSAITLEDADAPFDRWNDASVSWTSVLANETATHISLWGAASGGNPWYVGSLEPSMAMSAGGDASIGAGNIRVTIARHSP